MPQSIPFEEAAQIRAVASHEYEAHIHPDYSYGPAAHGGFLNSLLLNTIKLHFATTLALYQQPDTLLLHTELLRPATLGPVSLKVKDTRVGKGSSVVHVTLSQGGKERVAAYATNTNRAIKGFTVDTGYRLSPPIEPVDFEAALANSDPGWVRWEIPWKEDSMNRALSNVTLLLARVHNPEPRYTDLWLRCKDPAERWTTPMLGLAVDHLLPPVENFFPDSPHTAEANVAHSLRWAKEGPPKKHHTWSVPRWYLTASVTLDIKRALPPEGEEWLFLRAETMGCVDGRFDVSLTLWDRELNLVATSQQAWMLVEAVKIPKARGQPGIKAERSSKM